MSDKVEVKLGGDSPEEVAYKLLLDIAKNETGAKDRAWILNTYAECLLTVRHPNMRSKKD
ncbi:hypothetical protein GGC47_003172 [Bosea sp. OAE752]|uniref:hypothetical protein n=1 Tax=Bosea sp. OAE752 TaxID=2663873 RepID=UPI003D1F8196